MSQSLLSLFQLLKEMLWRHIWSTLIMRTASHNRDLQNITTALPIKILSVKLAHSANLGSNLLMIVVLPGLLIKDLLSQWQRRKRHCKERIIPMTALNLQWEYKMWQLQLHQLDHRVHQKCPLQKDQEVLNIISVTEGNLFQRIQKAREVPLILLMEDNLWKINRQRHKKLCRLLNINQSLM